MNWNELEEKFSRCKEVRPVMNYEYRGYKVGIAETDRTFLYSEKDDFPFGFYQTCWYVSPPGEDDILGGSWENYHPDHDSHRGWTEETKRQARINTAKLGAESWIDACVEAKYHQKQALIL